MKENIKYFETLNDADGYIINDIPFTSYIKEKGLVLFNNEPNKMIIILNNKAIVNEAVNIVFDTLNDADGYVIEEVPFSCYIKLNQQFLECNLENCEIVIENGVAVIKIKEKDDNIIRYTATSKVAPHQPSSLPTIISNDFDPNTGNGVIKFATDVETIGSLAFYSCTSLTSMTIDNRVSHIGYQAFCYCSNLASIKIPNRVTSIKGYAFAYCQSLTSVSIPNSITNIENSIFEHCEGLTSVVIPNSVTNIGNNAFRYCTSLTSITIPNSVINIKYEAFYNCSSLTSISYTGTISQYNSITKGDNWHSGVLATVVNCTDGSTSI